VKKPVHHLKELPSVQPATFALRLQQRRYQRCLEQAPSVQVCHLRRIAKLEHTVRLKKVKLVWHVQLVIIACHLQIQARHKTLRGWRSPLCADPLYSGLTTRLFFNVTNALLERYQQNLPWEMLLSVNRALKEWCALLKVLMTRLNQLHVPRVLYVVQAQL
jgi:hypothetical protein